MHEDCSVLVKTAWHNLSQQQHEACVRPFMLPSTSVHRGLNKVGSQNVLAHALQIDQHVGTGLRHGVRDIDTDGI